MTLEEIEIMDLTGELWNKIIGLPVIHPQDAPETAIHIHAIQNIILSREGLKKYKEAKEKEKENIQIKSRFL